MGILENEIPDDGRFYIQRTRYMHRIGNEFVKDTKTSSGERLCILPAPVIRDVRALRKHHIERKLKLGPLWTDSDYLIKEQNGEAFHPEQCAKRLSRYMERIGLEPITFHALRHTYASICISMGADPDTLVCTGRHWLYKTLIFQQSVQLIHTSAYWCILKKCYTHVTYHPLY